jgi:hypothetical protein
MKTFFKTKESNWTEITGNDVTQEDINTVEQILSENIPSNADLISANITIPQVTGIINFRVDGEHLQSRF